MSAITGPRPGERYILADKLAEAVAGSARSRCSGRRTSRRRACGHDLHAPACRLGYTFDVPLLDGDHVDR